MAFYVGQKVERWRDAGNRYRVAAPPLRQTVTVSNVFSVPGGDMIEIFEYPSPETDEYYAGFTAELFRPVVEKKTDISVFTEMLKPKQHKLVLP